jgi:hypothetical protein
MGVAGPRKTDSAGSVPRGRMGLPDECVVAQLSEAIRATHSVNPTSWGVTLFASRAYLRPNRSTIEMLLHDDSE